MFLHGLHLSLCAQPGAACEEAAEAPTPSPPPRTAAPAATSAATTPLPAAPASAAPLVRTVPRVHPTTPARQVVLEDEEQVGASKK
jgi:hypothetical protein